MKRLREADPNLMANLKKYLDPELYTYAEEKLEQFWHLCMTDIDRRAVHTDRKDSRGSLSTIVLGMTFLKYG
jgi:acyl-CoA dehydrogenase